MVGNRYTITLKFCGVYDDEDDGRWEAIIKWETVAVEKSLKRR